MAEREHIIDVRKRRQPPGYAEDYAAWVQHQIDLMRAGRWSEIDCENLIDEVEDLGKSEFNGFVSAIEVVLVHMLKWDYQPERRTRSWIASIVEHRNRIVQSLSDNPSFKARRVDALARAYGVAPARAAAETNLALDVFPVDNPYDWNAMISREQTLDS